MSKLSLPHSELAKLRRLKLIEQAKQRIESGRWRPSPEAFERVRKMKLLQQELARRDCGYD